MNLQIDIGNTFLKWRVVVDGRVVKRGGHATEFEEYLADFNFWDELEGVALASVASPECDARLLSVISMNRPDITPFVATTQAFFNGVSCAYESPSQMGVDRWLAIIAGYLRCESPCIVIDCGSAITVDIVNGFGVHEGGYIMPGVRLMRASLALGTKRVLFDDLSEAGVAVGRNTAECVGSGVNYMALSLVEQLKREMRTKDIGHLFVTGGDAELIASLCDGVEVMPDLVLDGLELVQMFNGCVN